MPSVCLLDTLSPYLNPSAPSLREASALRGHWSNYKQLELSRNPLFAGAVALNSGIQEYRNS